ncbi:MAG: ATP-dependent Clp protease adaptor ClpS, partial [Planctomycetota bacterium]
MHRYARANPPEVQHEHTIESTPTRKPNPTKPRPLPQWKVLVHNDDVNTYEHVIRSFMDILRMEVTMAL